MLFCKVILLAVLVCRSAAVANSNAKPDVTSLQQVVSDIRVIVENKLSGILDELKSTRTVIDELNTCCARATPTPKTSGPFNATFTNLGATGRKGPNEVGSHYQGKDHNNLVTVVKGIQHLTVPYTGQYTIEVAGAAGGRSTSSHVYGRGAVMKGTFSLTKGTKLNILVGQMGSYSEADQIGSGSGSGGGGSFVTAGENNLALIIAGGGGGVNYLSAYIPSTEQNGSVSAAGGGLATAATGGEGGGLLADGADGANGGKGGKAFINGGEGGLAAGLSNGSDGGFGGGGGAEGLHNSPGGGGGYRGGRGGTGTQQGGGGGSYNDGTNQENTPGKNAGHGYVIITKV